MKKILFFENSPLLQKAIKLILFNSHFYEITIVENLAKFENAKKSQIFDLIISHIDLMKPPVNKNTYVFQNILLMHEKSESIKEFKDFNLLYFIEKPFTSQNFKEKVDFILGIEDINSNKIETESKISNKLIQGIAKETLENWLREEAPKYAKEVIREEIMKLIS